MDKFPTLALLTDRQALDEALIRRARDEISTIRDPSLRKLLGSCLETLRSADRAASDAASAVIQLLGHGTAGGELERHPNAYSPRTLATRWLCSERHVRNLIKRGDLPHFRFGKLLRIKPSDVDDFERRNVVRPE
ncbi:helix-turn-helix domain-containing protein [Mesorhizobium sp.]|uniref:helix-turn-helix domain-containing protein n=1 Tax=Mesorhizobium sp. TaxID=1871066 RepID=UPI000FE7B0D1|nr:MAG: DNA-binding protein [Mesorhizobium sp.]RWK46579.1 MAG: DNA-binding protein [Mesorhizobium sp.]RWK90047.1 MAG: DNA-binding protein [Mesorhizobium sp.]TIP56886.1 MAG: helix-turn-helix domain-containing protein [Mesorhizobium sp.]TIP97463.1 MAG: helix-turn-helix domain-containing protein [Mesorhizobium sp.]